MTFPLKEKTQNDEDSRVNIRRRAPFQDIFWQSTSEPRYTEVSRFEKTLFCSIRNLQSSNIHDANNGSMKKSEARGFCQGLTKISTNPPQKAPSAMVPAIG